MGDIVIEHIPLGGRRLLSSFRHEWLGGQAIQFSKPCVDVGEHRFHQYTSTRAANTNAISLEPELARQA